MKARVTLLSSRLQVTLPIFVLQDYLVGSSQLQRAMKLTVPKVLCFCKGLAVLRHSVVLKILKKRLVFSSLAEIKISVCKHLSAGEPT